MLKKRIFLVIILIVLGISIIIFDFNTINQIDNQTEISNKEFKKPVVINFDVQKLPEIYEFKNNYTSIFRLIISIYTINNFYPEPCLSITNSTNFDLLKNAEITRSYIDPNNYHLLYRFSFNVTTPDFIIIYCNLNKNDFSDIILFELIFQGFIEKLEE